MSQTLSQVLDDDRRIKAHTRSAHQQLESALLIARRSVRSNPRARSVELDLARLLRQIEDLGTLVSKYPVEEPSTKRVSAGERLRALRGARDARQQKGSDFANYQDDIEESD